MKTHHSQNPHHADSRQTRNWSCLTRQPEVISALRELTPIHLGAVLSQIRRFFASQQFAEVHLGPFDAYPIDYKDQTLEVRGIGQLRFNTEPEIWKAAEFTTQFFSISSLFRRENVVNLLRRQSFTIIDFYQTSAPNQLMPVFQALLRALIPNGYIKHLGGLHHEIVQYDPITDAPMVETHKTRFVTTTGYNPNDSFFEIDPQGRSTRQELFLVTPLGYLEIGALGIVGNNANADYIMRNNANNSLRPPRNFSGMGIGLERLLLADQILALFLSLNHEDE